MIDYYQLKAAVKAAMLNPELRVYLFAGGHVASLRYGSAATAGGRVLWHSTHEFAGLSAGRLDALAGEIVTECGLLWRARRMA